MKDRKLFNALYWAIALLIFVPIATELLVMDMNVLFVLFLIFQAVWQFGFLINVPKHF